MPRRSCRARGHSKQRSRLPSASPRAASLCNSRQVPYPATKIQNPTRNPDAFVGCATRSPTDFRQPSASPRAASLCNFHQVYTPRSRVSNPDSKIPCLEPQNKKSVPKPETLANFGGLQTGPFIFLALIGNFSLRRRVIDRTFAAAERLSETCSALELRASSCIF